MGMRRKERREGEKVQDGGREVDVYKNWAWDWTGLVWTENIAMTDEGIG